MSKKKVNKRMMERYRNMNKFRYSIFQITNPAIPSEVKINPILARLVLNELKELREEIQADIDGLSIRMIDIEDIVGASREEVSELVSREVCLFDLSTIKKKYENYLNGEKLNKIFPVVDRKNRVIELQREIENIELTIKSLEQINPSLVVSQREKVQMLEREKFALEETLHFESLEDIKDSVFLRLYSYLVNLLNDFDSKINFLERNLV